MGGEFGFDADPDIALPFASECGLTWRIARFRGLSSDGAVYSGSEVLVGFAFGGFDAED